MSIKQKSQRGRTLARLPARATGAAAAAAAAAAASAAAAAGLTSIGHACEMATRAAE